MITLASEKTEQARLQLFGWWELLQRDQQVQVGNREQRLLALLALVGRRSRVQLAGTLWPESNEHHAMANLRAAVWQVRRACPDLLSVQGNTLALDPRVRVDVVELADYARAAARNPAAFDTGEAVGMLAQGDLLPGWYEDWVLFERERLDHLRIHALQALAAAALDDGRPQDCELAGRAALRIEPLHEAVNLLVIRGCLAGGSPADAVRHFDAYRQRLATELHIRPSTQLLELIRPLVVPRQR